MKTTTSRPLTPEQSAGLADFLVNLAAFVDGSDRRCLHCREAVTRAKKVGRCVYVAPCGCRQFQGSLPKWASPATP